MDASQRCPAETAHFTSHETWGTTSRPIELDALRTSLFSEQPRWRQSGTEHGERDEHHLRGRLARIWLSQVVG